MSSRTPPASNEPASTVPVDALVKLRELARRLPTGLESDWDGTNHYELTIRSGTDADGGEYWWLMVGDGVQGLDNPCESETGRRLGLLMDIAAEVCRLRDEGAI